MTFASEKQLEDLIFDNRQSMADRGLCPFYAYTERQYKLPSGRIIDLFTFEIKDDILYAKIVELKKDELNEAAIWQIGIYYEELLLLTLGYFKDYQIDLILVGDGMNFNVSRLVMMNCIIQAYTYNFGINGLTFVRFDNSSTALKARKFEPEPACTEFCDKLKMAWVSDIELMANENGISVSDMCTDIVESHKSRSANNSIGGLIQ